MEINTVLLSVQDYNELRDFKEKITEGYTFNTWRTVGGNHTHETWVTNSEAIKELSEVNNNLEKIIDELKYPILKEKSITEIKRMSIWEFIKWRKK